MYDWLIIGCGFTGATLAERIATVRGERVLIVDRRDHIGGNAYDYEVDGVLVHRYGPHIFHTNSDRVWAYLRPFSDWRPYEHRVRAVIDGRQVPLPFNLDSIEALFPPATAERYVNALRERHGESGQVPVLKLMRDPDPDVRALAEFVYEKVFHNYTLKQWGLTPEQLAPSVTARVPVRVGRDDRYFQDRHQWMPAQGYTALFGRMLDRPNVTVMLSTDYAAARAMAKGARTIHTGPIDAFFGYEFGPLPYRSLRFDLRMREAGPVQAVGTVNYPGDDAVTRVTEFRHLTGQDGPRTALMYEYPRAHRPGETEPYYPIPREENQRLLERYAARAAERDDVLFCGRLGEYRYYNMDQAVGSALALFDKRIAAEQGR